MSAFPERLVFDTQHILVSEVPSSSPGTEAWLISNLKAARRTVDLPCEIARFLRREKDVKSRAG